MDPPMFFGFVGIFTALLAWPGNYPTTIIIGDLSITELDTLCLFPMDSKLAVSNVTNDPLPKRPLGWFVRGFQFDSSLHVPVVWLEKRGFLGAI